MNQNKINKNIYSTIFSTEKKIVMGILNITKDSFYDGDKYNTDKKIIYQAKKMLDEGATIIDIGAQSSRPGAKQISSEQELKILIPTIKLLKKKLPDTNLSIDTFWSNTASKCIALGADMINDISAGNIDEKMLPTIAKINKPYILMHMKGKPKNMQTNPTYINLVEEIKDFFKEKIQQLNSLGFKKIILDPGFGFGKTLEDNYKLMNQLNEFQQFKYPILVGISRKSMIYNLLNGTANDALNGTSILNTIALQKGARILRVHDAKEAIECIKINSFLNEKRRN
ncbi:MAG: dihydropteroate synthase [Flavobacteriales bacterium]|nr:dihydropteroate synthase [Flavobacteriales bacterium]|tara:strand:- start:61069 stop:61920 length:852 start_codon:yes stop_codon:yes gene_type:complete